LVEFSTYLPEGIRIIGCPFNQRPDKQSSTVFGVVLRLEAVGEGSLSVNNIERASKFHDE
jgi:hypothetical protein